MLEIAHFSVGAGLTTLLITLGPGSVRNPRTTMVLGGLWAMLPDIHWVLPIFDALILTIHSSVVANIFWFHPALDALDPGDSMTTAALVFTGFLTAVAFGEWYAYRTPPSFDRIYNHLGGHLAIFRR